MSFFKKHKRGIIGTVIYHTILIVILFFFGFFTPLPLPGEEGILVNFGDNDNGMGKYEPAPKEKQQKKQQKTPIKKQPKKTPPPKSIPEKTAPKKTNAKEVAMVQDYEKTAAIDAELERKLKAEKERKRKLEEAELKRKREEEARKKAMEEELKRKREEEARQKAIEAERKRREEQQKRIEERTKGAFSNNNAQTGAGKDKGNNQGVTYKPGNQGVKTGGANTDNYGKGGKGSGQKGSGVSFSLKGRNALSLPKPKYPGNDEGVVVVKVTVDKFGKVKTAEPGAHGTTLMNKRFWNEAKKAALAAKFNVDDNAPAFQQGTISYRFVLD